MTGPPPGPPPGPIAGSVRAAERRTLSGWGRTAPSEALVTPIHDLAGVVERMRAGDAHGVLARGLGRAYGDAALNGGGELLDMTALRGVRHHDPTSGITCAWAGTSLDALLRQLVPHGWFLPVTPGTRHVTVGGAIAADVHGKNHHVDGSITRHVSSFELLTPDGQLREVLPGEPAFLATAGGMGLTGVIVSATLQMLPIRSSAVQVRTERVDDLDAVMQRMVDRDGEHRYSVAWVDCLARGGSMGRGVLTCGDHAEPDALRGRWRGEPLRYRPRQPLATPRGLPNGLLRPVTVAAFNEMWYRRAPRDHVGPESLAAFFHPLDAVRNWNRIYGPAGFVQYQFVVPFAAHEVVTESVRRLSAARSPAFLAVLKRFGASSPAPLSFPQPGWTLALDLPASVPGLPTLLRGLDELVATAGGRVYLAKDSRLGPDMLALMYPRLPEWRGLVRALDPKGRMCSDLSRRLGLLPLTS